MGQAGSSDGGGVAQRRLFLPRRHRGTRSLRTRDSASLGAEAKHTLCPECHELSRVVPDHCAQAVELLRSGGEDTWHKPTPLHKSTSEASKTHFANAAAVRREILKVLRPTRSGVARVDASLPTTNASFNRWAVSKRRKVVFIRAFQMRRSMFLLCESTVPACSPNALCQRSEEAQAQDRRHMREIVGRPKDADRNASHVYQELRPQGMATLASVTDERDMAPQEYNSTEGYVARLVQDTQTLRREAQACAAALKDDAARSKRVASFARGTTVPNGRECAWCRASLLTPRAN